MSLTSPLGLILIVVIVFIIAGVVKALTKR